MGLHHVALLVANIIAAALRILDTQQLALRGADANREDAQAGLGRLFCGFQRAGIMIFPIGEKHQHLIVVAFLESRQGRLNCFSDGRATLGDDIDVERLDALAKGRVVNGQRALQERAAGERDQA